MAALDTSNAAAKEVIVIFIWDFVADLVLGQILDWIYGKAVEFLSEFLSLMDGMGIELFEFVWVESVVEFFRYFGWALYGVGLVVAVFEAAMEYQAGRPNAVRDMAIGVVKGFFAVSLFSVVPVELYRLCIDLQGSLSQGIAGASNTEGVSSMARAVMGGLNGYGALVALFLLVLMGYSVFKVFFANLKRGGILLIQIAVGSLYLFSVPRGYTDGFYGWCRQVAGLCLTAFLQTTMLIAGLMVCNSNMLLGCGLMLSSAEVPRIAQQFGLDTSAKANIMSAVYTTQTAVNLSRSLIAAIK